MSKNKKKKSNQKNYRPQKIEYKVKETKSVPLDKIKVVKEIHKLNNMNPDKYEMKKHEMKDLVEKNKGKYPKSEAILVWRKKDSEDKRRVIYELEDGLRRYLIAKDFNLENIQVNIIDDEQAN